MKAPCTQRGVTLVELVIAIVIMAFAAVALLGTMAFISKNSGETLATHQASAIAHSYLDEALSKAFVDPDGVPEANRAQFDNVADFNGLPDTIVRAPDGTAIAALNQYRVTVNVAGGALGGLPAADVLRVDVQVTHQMSDTTVLATGFRTRF
jgi:MSHA pilin protein MshD